MGQGKLKQERRAKRSEAAHAASSGSEAQGFPLSGVVSCRGLLVTAAFLTCVGAATALENNEEALRSFKEVANMVGLECMRTIFKCVKDSSEEFSTSAFEELRNQRPDVARAAGDCFTHETARHSVTQALFSSGSCDFPDAKWGCPVGLGPNNP